MKAPLYLQLTNSIEEYIKAHKLPVGHKLPSERELCRQYHVSRSVVREALRLLNEKGIIEQRMGQGAYVANPDSKMFQALQMVLVNNKVTLMQVLEVREVLEKSIVSLAIENLDDQKLARLEKHYHKLDLARQKNNSEEFMLLDVAFHEEIAKCIPNPFFHTLLKAFYQMGNDDSFLITRSSRALLQAAQSEHRDILSAIGQRNARQAVLAVEAHMRNVRQDLLTME